MNIDTLTDTLITAICTNVDINTWCQVNYIKSVSVYKGFDLDNPPPDTDYPVVCLYPVSKEIG